MKIILLDRDGVINHDSDAFIKTPDEWVAIDGSLEAIARLNQAGWRVVVASNQSGIGRGLFSMATLNQIHRKMHQQLLAVGGHLDGVFFCPHTGDSNCECRKPKAGLLHDIAQRFDVNLSGVPMVGDSLRDLQAGVSVGAKPYLVRTGKGRKTLATGNLPEGTQVFDDLAAVVATLLTH